MVLCPHWHVLLLYPVKGHHCSFVFILQRHSTLKTVLGTVLWKRDQQSPSVSTDSFGIQAARIWTFYWSTMYNCIRSQLLSAIKTCPIHPMAQFTSRSHFPDASVIVQLSSTHKSLFSSPQTPTINCRAKLHTSSRNSQFQPCITQSFIDTWFFLHFIPITLGGVWFQY